MFVVKKPLYLNHWKARGEPRTKWFFPVEKGYLQQPTVVNNVETFCAVAQILDLGTDEYLKLGIPALPAPNSSAYRATVSCRAYMKSNGV